MKTFLKYFLIVIAIILIVALSGVAFIEVRGIPTYETGKLEYKVASTPERVERGKKLVMLLCANCHKNQSTGKLTGEQMMEAPHEFGKIFSQNITQDKTFGIGEWTDGEIVYLLRTGIKRNGKYAPPYMAKLPNMADEDINAIISFLHSNDPMVSPSATPDYPCEPTFLTKLLCSIAFKPLKYPDHKIEMPDTNNPVALGKYLVYNLECFNCHSADFKTNDLMIPEKSAGYLGGGNKPLNREGKAMITQNLTPDMETGIGKWSEQRFVNAVKFGIMENDAALRYPMIPFVYLTDNEAKAIYQYLRTVPPIKNKVPRSPI